MRVAVIGRPGGWSTERLAAALRQEGIEAPIIDLGRAGVRLPEGGVFEAGRPLGGLDGALVKKIGDAQDGWLLHERINVLRHLERSGIPVLSPPDRLEVAVDRYRMTLELASIGLPIPETIVTEDLTEAVATVERFGRAVLKPLFTSKGRGMRRVRAGSDAAAALTQHQSEHPGPFYLQRFIDHPGRDLGLAVLDGRVLGAYWRMAKPDQWMTTILAGGRYEAATPSAEAIELAERAARHFGLLFTGVDLVETPGGGFVVLEVSAFGGFRGLATACGIDAAPLVAKVALGRFEASVRP